MELSFEPLARILKHKISTVVPDAPHRNSGDHEQL